MFLVSTFNDRLVITFDKVISQASVKIFQQEKVIYEETISACNTTSISLERKFTPLKVEITENDNTESRTIFF